MKLNSLNRLAVCGGMVAAAFVIVSSEASAAGSKICFEAETATSVTAPVKKVSGAAKDGYSGSGFIEIPWDRNKTKGIGEATFKVKAKTAGVYYLWARTFWANGCGNSIAVEVNTGSEKILGEDGTYERWHWIGGGNIKVALKAGENTLVLKNRETGIRVDQFYLTQDAGYIPQGPRKPTT